MPKPRNRSELTIPSRTEALARVRRFVRRKALRMGFTEEAVDQIVIAVDEACSNIIRHAYGGDPAQQIQIVVDTYPDRLEITLSDQGRRFDPSTYREPDPQKLARSGQRGGLGLLLMRRLMDEIQYDYRDEFNIVRLIKYL